MGKNASNIIMLFTLVFMLTACGDKAESRYEAAVEERDAAYAAHEKASSPAEEVLTAERYDAAAIAVEEAAKELIDQQEESYFDDNKEIQTNILGDNSVGAEIPKQMESETDEYASNAVAQEANLDTAVSATELPEELKQYEDTRNKLKKAIEGVKEQELIQKDKEKTQEFWQETLPETDLNELMSEETSFYGVTSESSTGSTIITGITLEGINADALEGVYTMENLEISNLKSSKDVYGEAGTTVTGKWFKTPDETGENDIQINLTMTAMTVYYDNGTVENFGDGTESPVICVLRQSGDGIDLFSTEFAGNEAEYGGKLMPGYTGVEMDDIDPDLEEAVNEHTEANHDILFSY